MTNISQLENTFKRIADLEHAQAMLRWDEAVIMPSGGQHARVSSIATIGDCIHRLLCDDSLLNDLQAVLQTHSLTDWQQRNCELMQHRIQCERAVPEKLSRELNISTLNTERLWRDCRKKNDWATLQPALQTTFSLVRDKAQALAAVLDCSPYDALLDHYTPGLSQSDIDPLFDQIAQHLPDIRQRAENKQARQTKTILSCEADAAAQYAMCDHVMKSLGFKTENGRLDLSDHPFCGSEPEDTRITMRINEDDYTQALMATCHETGHALYQFGLPKKWQKQPIGSFLGYAVHESQSLLIEMHVCRSQAFCEYLAPQLKSMLNLSKPISATALYQKLTDIERGLIRVDADEVNYPFHVLLRYDIEKQLLAGECNIADLPELWHSLSQQYFQRSVHPHHADGVMQDVHWPSGCFGYFPAYLIGSMMAAQFYASMQQDGVDTTTHIQQGDFSGLLNWLKQNVHQHASRPICQQLLMQTTSSPLSANALLQHLQTRYC